jgi:Zn-finger nucleic acid-binding protein
MQCPVCKTVSLVEHELESQLPGLKCPACEGQWLKSFNYWRWVKQQGENRAENAPDEGLPLTVVETGRAPICPECGHILLRYKVGHDLTFTLDRCSHCGGVWFDKNEWAILKSRNLHDDLHFIFSPSWQAEVTRLERRVTHEQILRERLGEPDFAEAQRIKQWLDAHPQKHALLAYLANPEP